jgi:hypothetical protein
MDVVRILAEEVGVNTQAATPNGFVALDMACSRNRSAVVGYLIDELGHEPQPRTLEIACVFAADIARRFVQRRLVDWRLARPHPITAELQRHLAAVRATGFLPGLFHGFGPELRASVVAVLLVARAVPSRPLRATPARLCSQAARAVLRTIPLELLVAIFDAIIATHTRYVHPHPLAHGVAHECACCESVVPTTGLVCAQCDFALCAQCGHGLGPRALAQ